MKGAVELFVSGSSKIDCYTLSKKYIGCIINPNRKAVRRKKKLRCYQPERNITWLVINAKIFQVTEMLI